MDGDLRRKQIKPLRDLPKAGQKVPMAKAGVLSRQPQPSLSLGDIHLRFITAQHKGGSQRGHRAGGVKQAAASPGLTPSAPQAREEPQLQIKWVPSHSIKQKS